MKKLAHIYWRDDSWYLHADSRTVAGYWIATEPFIRLGIDESFAKKGEACRAALFGTHHDILPPTETANLLGPLLKLAGTESWPSFAKKASCISVSDQNGQITITPHRKRKRPVGAFQGIDDQSIIISDAASLGELGEAIQKGFEVSE